ncbi:MAG: hypothetical protein OXC29_23215, partial [Rhodococcus sp.]|nr:hypothetical protein [Rhodococcus sp. (in: high G+C Gram-positive bacteria)]
MADIGISIASEFDGTGTSLAKSGLDDVGEAAVDASRDLDKLGRETKDADGELGRLGDSASDADGGLGDVGLSAGALTGKLKGLAGPTAIGAAVLALGAMAAAGAGAALNLTGWASISGLSTTTLQKFGRIARGSKGDMEDVADAAREMQLRMAEAESLGTGPMVDAMRLLGLELEDFQGLNVDQSFNK